MHISKKIGLLMVPVIAGVGAIAATSIPSAHAASQPVTSVKQSSAAVTEAKDAPEANSATESPETNKADDPNGPNIEQTGQN